MITDSRRVVLRGSPPQFVNSGLPELELEGIASNPRMWVNWAWGSYLGYTNFTWGEPDDENPQHIWMSRAEARQYLISRVDAGDPYATECWADLRARGVTPELVLVGAGRSAPIPAAGTRGWGPYCTRCRINLSTQNMVGYESVGGRYYGLCDNCKEHEK